MITVDRAAGMNNNISAGSIGMQADSFSKNIQNKISQVQKEMQEISSKEELTPEEKMKKRQELQQEIAALNQQLRQHQSMQRKEKQASKSSLDDMIGGKQKSHGTKAGRKAAGFSNAGMQAIISAGSSMKMAQTQGATAVQMEGKANVLESEIKTDASRGSDTQKKEEELADLKDRAQDALTAQISSLAEANQTIDEAAKADQSDDDGKNKDQQSSKPDKADSPDHAGNTSSTAATESTGQTAEAENAAGINHAPQADDDVSSKKAAVSVQENISVQTAAGSNPPAYHSVDIRL